MNLECMLYLQSKGILSADKNRMLDIGPQNVYHCSVDQIRQFVTTQGGDVSSAGFWEEAKRLEYYSTPRKDERTTLFSEIADLTNIDYLAFDVCPAFKTEILDLNYDVLQPHHVGSFDVVLNFGTTEHIFNQWNSFQIMHDALKTGGVLYCVLPASGYLDHGYYCYTPLFFEDLAAANGYEILDMFFAQAGENNLEKLGADVRREGAFLVPSSAYLDYAERKIPCFNIHAVMRKTQDGAFRCGLEVATAHADANPDISARYSGEAPSAPSPRGAVEDQLRDSVIKLEQRASGLEQSRRELELRVYQLETSTSWRITAPLRSLVTLFKLGKVRR